MQKNKSTETGQRTHPAYLGLLRSGELAERVQEAYHLLSLCHVCAWRCKADRTAGKEGVCHTGLLARVSSVAPHMGEEDPLRGWRGSGTIFFSLCNLHCQFCQNSDISQFPGGREVEPEELAAMMMELQDLGCHNINFVSPSHVVPQILAALLIAAERGLRLPLVYNTGGYDSLEMLQLLDGVVDIYMPDMKYADTDTARQHSKVVDYPEINQAAVQEMHRQVGDLVLDESGVATRGLLVRHLVLPDQLAGTAEIVQFLAQKISPHTYLNVMPQYRPAYKAHEYPALTRPITGEEYEAALQLARQAGLHRLDERRPLWQILKAFR
ncbi:MAG: radical SAM protein [Fidelibacterota bacterium]|nr:MAG: radical SAM protein [Candidatus Neomarinimicrobiota bacterium]